MYKSKATLSLYRYIPGHLTLPATTHTHTRTHTHARARAHARAHTPITHK